MRIPMMRLVVIINLTYLIASVSITYAAVNQIGPTLIGASGDSQSALSMGGSGNNTLGDIIAVGSYNWPNLPTTPESSRKRGKVDIYKIENDSLRQFGTIYGTSGNDYFGEFLSVSGDGRLVAVGALSRDTPFTNAGEVRVFKWNLSDSSPSWNQFGSTLSGNSSDEFFGRPKLNGDGTVLAVGAGGWSNNTGKVYVYGWDTINQDWMLRDNLIGQGENHYYGDSISLSRDGSVLTASGFPLNSNNESNGYTNVYRWNGNDYILEQTITSSPGDALLGASLSADGNRLVIGAPEADRSFFTNNGYAKVFEYSNSTWVQIGQEITGDFSDQRIVKGKLDETGNTLLISSRLDGNGYRGQVEIYRYYNSSWYKINGPIIGEGEYDYFGDRMSINWNTLKFAVGARQWGNYPDYVQTNDSRGYVKVYQIDPDSDADGLPDEEELFYNTNRSSSDSDFDSLPDGYEVYTSLTDPNSADSDGDGVNDYWEVIISLTDPNNADSYEYLNFTLKGDVDGDGNLDINEDVDGDGNLDVAEDIDGDGNLDINEDVDGDGNLDVAEDIDGDGNLDIAEDVDGDGTLDVAEDVDGDGNLDVAEDVDGDGNLDVAEDVDGDGNLDVDESLVFNGAAYEVSDCLTTATGFFEIPSIYNGLPVTSIGQYAFDKCSNLASITIPNSITSIGAFAFRDCSSLTDVTIPDNMTSIVEGAFDSCTGLTDITIPESVTSIGRVAFYGCSSLTSVTIPDSVTSIEGRAFALCSGLSSVIFEGDAPSFGTDDYGSVFSESNSVTVYYYDDATGFSTPTFQGRPSQMLIRDTTPRVPVLSIGNFYESFPLVNITIDATPTDGYPNTYNYQWYFNGFAVPANIGGTSNSYVINGIAINDGDWAVEVTNDTGITRSEFVYRLFVDSDGDTISDYRETNFNGTNPNSADTDSDGIADNIETNSGIYVDATDTGTDPNKSDTDGDGLDDLVEISTHSTNPLDSDSDDDGATDGYEITTSLTNPNNPDSDTDGLSDGQEIYQYSTDPKDTDSDDDTLSDYTEVVEIGTNPNSQDSDGDGLNDAVETNTGVWVSTLDTGTNPLSNDSDSDGLSDIVETNTTEYIDASDTGTDPNDSDSDSDGLLDGSETNTNVYVSTSDTGTNPLESDSDYDGYSDYVETNTGTWTSANDTGTDPNRGDTDNDGIIDGRETNTGIFVSATNTGTNPINTDSDGDGFTDKFEIDTSYDPTSSDDTPDAYSFIETAVEVNFYGANGGTYRIEHADDLESDTWVTVENGIEGSSELIERLYSTDDYSRRFFRVVRTDQ